MYNYGKHIYLEIVVLSDTWRWRRWIAESTRGWGKGWWGSGRSWGLLLISILLLGWRGRALVIAMEIEGIKGRRRKS